MPQGKPLKVAVLAATADGGHPEYVSKLLRAVQEASIELQVLWPIPPQLHDRYRIRESFTTYEVMPSSPHREVVGTRAWAASRLAPWRRQDAVFIGWLLRHVRDVDVVLIEELQRFTLPLVVGAARALSKRVVVQLHNARRHDYRGSVVDQVDEIFTALGLRLAHKVVVHDEHMRHTLLERAGRKVFERTVIMPHGVEPRVDVLMDPPSSPQYLFFGVNRANKGLHVFVEAMKLMPPEARGRVVGSTPADRVTLTQQLLAAAVNVTWQNRYLEDLELFDLFQATTAVVLPYTSFEAQSGVLHLAIEFGVPVVVTDVGGMAGLTNSLQLGEVVPADDAVALADAMKRLGDVAVNRATRRRVLTAQRQLRWETVSHTLLKALVG